MSDVLKPSSPTCEQTHTDSSADPVVIGTGESSTSITDNVPVQSGCKEEKTLSKRAMKRMKRAHDHNAKAEAKKAKKKRKKDIDIDISAETSCYYQNGLRKVYPYIFTFTTYAKQRWLNVKLVDVFTNEFKHFAPHVFRKKVDKGEICVNGTEVGVDYVLKDNDFISNTAHRHEVPVSAEPIGIIHDSEDLLVINKPSSIPCHPCGNFRHNSAIFILDTEYGYKRLRFVHRIDRLTSGLLLLAKNEAKAAQLCRQVANRELRKEYLCRVEGKFPDGIIECNERLDLLSHKLGIQYVAETGKDAKTTFERLSYNGTSSVVKCNPLTGRTHQIRVHLQYLGYPIINDPMYNDKAWGPNKGKGGHYGKTTDEVIACMLRDHDRMKYVMAELNPVDDQTTKTAQTCDISSNGTEVSQLIDDTIKSLIKTTEDSSPTDAKNNSEEHLIPTDNNVISLTNDELNSSPNEKTVQKTIESVTIKSKAATSGSSERPDVMGSRSNFDSSKMTNDPNCPDCIRQFKDPKPEELVMYLHALKYKGPDWEYSTPLPHWADSDWHE